MKTRRGLFHRLLVIVVTVLLGAGHAMAAGSEDSTAQSASAAKTDTYTLSVTDGRISLKADKAPFQQVARALESALGIEIETHVDDGATLTTVFSDLPLKEAVKRISENYAYVLDEKNGKVDKIVLYPRGKEISASLPQGQLQERTTQEPKAAASLERSTDGSLSTAPEDLAETASVVEEDTGKQEPIHRKPGSSQSFEFAFDPSQYMKKE